jgi:hypothetical protein
MASHVHQDNRADVTRGFRLDFPPANSTEVAMQSQCWICGRQEDGLALMVLLLPHLKSRNKVQDCLRQCEKLETSSEVISARFYHLECSHYWASHIAHRCCVCRAKDSPQKPRPPQAANN